MTVNILNYCNCLLVNKCQVKKVHVLHVNVKCDVTI